MTFSTAIFAVWTGVSRVAGLAREILAAGRAGELATRVSGSADLYGSRPRRPYASINFVTAHDGFTLPDLLSYNQTHNDANGEGNRDGESHNRSWNCGVEGPTDDLAVLTLRARQQRNLLAAPFLSQGVPMLLSGDEVGRSQGGNNNAYCQDNEISWFDWAHRDEELLARLRAGGLTSASAAAASASGSGRVNSSPPMRGTTPSSRTASVIIAAAS